MIPPIYGLKGVGFETFTADGPISYWNSYVGVGQMGGHGSFSDPRIGLRITQTPDLVTPKLPRAAGLPAELTTPSRRARQLRSGRPPARQASCSATRRGCATCHQAPNFTDVLSGPTRRVPFLHDPAEVGTDARVCGAHARRGKYRTTPLRGAAGSTRRTSTTAARPICWPSSITTIGCSALNLTGAQKADLVEYFESPLQDRDVYLPSASLLARLAGSPAAMIRCWAFSTG